MKISRAMIRGKPLIHKRPYFDCNRARTSTHEYGPDDPRVLCNGRVEWIDPDGDRGPFCKECRECPAWAMGDYCLETPWTNDVKFNPNAVPRTTTIGAES